MLDHTEKQQRTFNHRYGDDIFARRVTASTHLVGSLSCPAYLTDTVAEFTDQNGPFDASWIGLTPAGFDQLRRIARGLLLPGERLEDGAIAALGALDIPFIRETATGAWRLHHEYSLALFPAGMPGLAEMAAAPTTLDRDPLAVARALGVSKAKLAKARRERESILRRRRAEAEARMEEEWGEACRVAGEAEEAAEAAR